MKIHKPKTRRRSGYTLLELVISTGAASVLVVGMTSTLLISNQALEAPKSDNALQNELAEIHRELLLDLQQAKSFTERTEHAITFCVADRNLDGADEVLRYAWSGTPGDPLTLETNGGPPVVLVDDVQQFDLSFFLREMIAPEIVEDIPETGPRLLFVSAGTISDYNFFDSLDGESRHVIPTPAEEYTIALFDSWGYNVTIISSAQTSEEISAAEAEANLIYISPDVEQNHPAWLRSAHGVVIGAPYFIGDFGFALEWKSHVETTVTIDGSFPDHYVIADLPANEQSQLLVSESALTGPSNGIAPHAVELAVTIEGLTSVAAFSPGATDINGRVVPGRRVHLPWGRPGFSETHLTQDGLTLLQKSLEWASGQGGDVIPGTATDDSTTTTTTTTSSSTESATGGNGSKKTTTTTTSTRLQFVE